MSDETKLAASPQARAEVSRRKFIITGAAGLGAGIGALAAGVPAFGAQANGANVKRKVLHIIGHSHIDAAWLWTWRDGANVVLTTFRSALDRIAETPGFKYTHSSATHYSWVERADPKMFAEIQARIREGRWEPVGGWSVEPDCNIPSTESFVRHALYGKDYFRRKLGTETTIGFNPDSFGHGAGLPSILRSAGYKYYVFMRPQENEMNLPLLFWWEAPDGSRVLTLRIRRAYSMSAERIADARDNNFAPGFDHAAYFLGVGNHGGGVTKAQIKRIIEQQSDPNLPELRWSTVGEFFAAVEKSPTMANLPVVRSELQHHARGCYSAHGEGKLLNRRAEKLMAQAEAIGVAASVNNDHPYPQGDFKEAWDKILFNQFHDLMAGTALYTAFQESRDQMGAASDTAQDAKVIALSSMARRVDARNVKEGSVFVFNPLPWARRALVEYPTDKDPSLAPWQPPSQNPITHLLTQDGQKVPIQWRPSDSMTQFWQRISAWVELPPLGYKVLELAHGDAPQTEPYKEFFRVNDEGFGISSLKAEDGKELLAAPLGLVVISDPSDTWGHGIDRFRQEMGRPMLTSSERIEDGPVVHVTRQRAKWMNSEIILDIAQHKAIDAIELRFVIDWREHEQILKLELPVALQSPRVFTKVPGAVAERKTNGDEEPYQDWAAVQGKIGNQDYTVGLINNATYSYDCQGGVLRTILVRSAPFARHDPHKVPHNDNNAWQDQGRQERRFWIVRGRGAYTALALDRLAEEMQTPAEYVMDSRHEGTEPWERSFLSVAPASVSVLAIKRAETGDGVIVRVQERAGTATDFRIESEPLALKHNARLKAWEIKTLHVSRTQQGRAAVREVDALER